MKPNRKMWLVLAVAAGAVYAGLRIWNLTASCLWFDEIFSVHAAEHDWQSLFSFVARDLIHPPLFYVLLKIWILAGGESLFWLRLFPVFFSLLALVPFILLCRELKISSLVMTLAMAFLAVNGALIKYAQEVRMYSLLLCLGLFSMWLFAHFFYSGRGFLILLVVNILLVYSHYFGWLVVLSEVLAVLVLARGKLKQILLMLGLTALSFTPWVFEVWRAARINAGFGQNLGWAERPNLSTIFRFVCDLFEPVYYQQISTEETTIFLISVPILLISATAFVFLLLDRETRSDAENRNFYLLLIFSFAPVLSAFLASWGLPFSIWGTRHLLIIFAPFVILLATAFSNIRIRWLKLTSLVVVFLLFGAAFLIQLKREQPKFIWCAWENLANDLRRANSDETTKIYVFEDLVAYHFWFALRDAGGKFQVIKVNGIEGLNEDTAYFLPRGFDAVKTTDATGFEGERFWIAFRAQDWDESKPPLRNLKALGFKLGEPQVFEAQGAKAFLVEAALPQ